MLLIPNRIRQIKEEGRAEARWEAFKEAFAEGFEKGRREAFEEAFEEARREALRSARERRRRIPRSGDENLERLQNLVESYNSGRITTDELDAVLSLRYGGGRDAD